MKKRVSEKDEKAKRRGCYKYKIYLVGLGSRRFQRKIKDGEYKKNVYYDVENNDVEYDVEDNVYYDGENNVNYYVEIKLFIVMLKICYWDWQ